MNSRSDPPRTRPGIGEVESLRGQCKGKAELLGQLENTVRALAVR